jgi:hypothetical protein
MCSSMQEFHKLAAALLQPSATKTIHWSFKNNRNGVYNIMW